MFPNCVMFDLIIEHEIFFEPFRCTYFLFDPTPSEEDIASDGSDAANELDASDEMFPGAD